MFTHLATRTCYSLRDGVIRPAELARAAAEAGMEAVGIADRGGLYGMVRVAKACAEVGVRPIFGVDLALLPEGIDRPGERVRPGWEVTRATRSGIGRQMGPGSGPAWLEGDTARVVLIARDDAGFATLCRTVTDHHLESTRTDPHLSWAQAVHRLGAGDGVVVLLGDDSPVGRLLHAGRRDAAEAELRRWVDLVGTDRVVLGVTHHLAPGDDARARRWFALADRTGIRAVAHQAARYLRPADALVADVMDAVRQQIPLDPRPHRDGTTGHAPPTRPLFNRRNAEGWFKDPAAMARLFAERPDAIANAQWVADQCHVDLGIGRLRVPDFTDAGVDAMAELRQRCEHGLAERYPTLGPTHHDLLDRELAMVHRLGLAPYFLTVAEIMDRIRSKGILAACRGSAAGSLITYALRISDVDPIAHDLVFERFMNPYRDELPDIDIDVESARREDIYRDLLDTYGEHRVACVCMIETFKARMAIREVGKAMGLPEAEVDHVAKSFPHVRAGDVRAALDHLPELQGLNLDRGQMRLLFDVVERLDGFPRHVALHPSGVLLADEHLRDLVPMERSAAGFAMAQLDKDDVEALGLCKLDVLAVRMLSSMAHCLDEVRRVRGVDIRFDCPGGSVPSSPPPGGTPPRTPPKFGWADPDTYELIQSTRTLGMFQIESPGQRELIGKFQPEHLDDLVVDISLFRPGPVKGDMVHPFLRRRHGREASTVPHPLLERALADTYGVIVYHEQVMRAVAAVTGCDLSEADLVRRRLGDPDELEGLRRWVLDGARRRGLDEDVAQWLWTALSQFGSFGFCKAHAAAFAVPTYRSAWLKAHVMPEFVAGLLTHDPGMYPRRLLLDDARQFGVAVLPLDVNRSARDYRVERVPAAEAWARLGVAFDPEPRLPRGWRWEDGWPVPPAGFDKGRAEPRAGDPPPTHPWEGERYAIRLALQDVERIDEAMIDSLLAGRPFSDVADLRRRARLSQPVAEALAHVGALDAIGGVTTGERSRRDLLLEVTERWSGVSRHRPADPAAPTQTSLLQPDPRAGLPDYSPAEQVRAELEVLGLDASRHVISFYDTLLDRLGVTRAVDLLDCRERQRIRIAGVKVATQTPPVRSGQRVIFLSLDDGTGVGDATFFESVHERCAWTVFHTWLLVVEGVVHRTGRRGVSLTADRAWDLRRLMVAWQEGWLDEALREDLRPSPGGAPTPSRPGRPRALGTDLDPRATDFTDGAPSEAIRGAPGRSGLVLRDGEHLQLARPVPYRGGARDADQPAEADTWAARDPRRVARSPAARLPVPRNAPHGPGRPPWEHVPPGRRGDPAGPPRRPGPIGGEPPRKLWHSSGGSAGA